MLDIYVDADACPVRKEVFSVAERHGLTVYVVTQGNIRVPIDPRLRLFVATGFVGAYTTFSTFEWETQRLTSTGALGWAVVNVLTSIVAGYAAVQLGVYLARR